LVVSKLPKKKKVKKISYLGEMVRGVDFLAG